MTDIQSILARLKSDEPGSLDFNLDVMKVREEVLETAELAPEIGCWQQILYSPFNPPEREGGVILPYTTSLHPQDCHWEVLPENWEWDGLSAQDEAGATPAHWTASVLTREGGLHQLARRHTSLPRAMLIAAFEARLVEAGL